MKKIIALFLTLVIAFSTTAVLAAEVSVTVDGEAVEFDQGPVFENGTLLLPLRFIIEKMGGKVSWHEETRTVFTDYNGKITTLQIGNELLFVENETISLPFSPVIKGDRTLVSVECINFATGAAVDFGGTAVDIYSPIK